MDRTTWAEVGWVEMDMDAHSSGNLVITMGLFRNRLLPKQLYVGVIDGLIASRTAK